MPEQEPASDGSIIKSFTVDKQNRGSATIILPENITFLPLPNNPDFDSESHQAKAMLTYAATKTLVLTAQAIRGENSPALTPYLVGESRIPDALSHKGKTISVTTGIRHNEGTVQGYAVFRDETSRNRKRIGIIRNIGLRPYKG